MKLEPLQIIRSVGQKDPHETNVGYLAEHFSAFELRLIQSQPGEIPETQY